MSVTVRAVPGFLPSTAGFHFPNRWPSEPVLRVGFRIGGPVPIAVETRIGDAANGLCGGMALATLDRWARHEPPPQDGEPPEPGSSLFREIVRRQLDSLGLGTAVVRFYRAAATSDRGRARIAVREAWPAIRHRIDGGRPAGLGLIHVASRDPRRLVGDHQVVAYGYELNPEAGSVVLRVYDPNHPDDDAVSLRLTLDRGRMDRAPAALADPGRDRRLGRTVAFDYIAGEAPVLGIVALRDMR